MLRFALNRLLQAIPTLLVVVALTFLMVRLAPGDPFSQERNFSPEARVALQKAYGLDRPVHEQFFLYVWNILPKRVDPGALLMMRDGRPTGLDFLGGFGIDFGVSMRENRTVNSIILAAFPVSLQVGGLAFAFALLIGVPLGMLAAVKRNTWLDGGTMVFALVGICLPTFVIGPILALVFGLGLQWFPSQGWAAGAGSWEYAVLPAAALGLVFSAYFARLTRGGMLEVLSQDYIRTARAKGVSEVTILWKHAFRGGILPVVAFMGPAFAGLISGSFVIERVFNIPGLGQQFINGVTNRDYSLVLGTVIFYGALVIVMNLVVDIAQVILNPRLKFD